jgi:hypothetical protein
MPSSHDLPWLPVASPAAAPSPRATAPSRKSAEHRLCAGGPLAFPADDGSSASPCGVAFAPTGTFTNSLRNCPGGAPCKSPNICRREWFEPMSKPSVDNLRRSSARSGAFQPTPPQKGSRSTSLRADDGGGIGGSSVWLASDNDHGAASTARDVRRRAGSDWKLRTRSPVR